MGGHLEDAIFRSLRANINKALNLIDSLKEFEIKGGNYTDFRKLLTELRDTLVNTQLGIQLFLAAKKNMMNLASRFSFSAQVETLNLVLSCIEPTWDLKRTASVTRYLAKLDEVKAVLELLSMTL
ncbi:MAG: hypothetical protein DRK00_11550 [Thermoprotei archaeon]|nr:MAG: hypothetical protein DRK00_11550 [Thermoprotei archaeon]